MTPVPIELPVKAGEAGALAEIVFQQAHDRKLNANLRSRIGARIAALQLSIPVFPGSLARDPIHPSAYYIATDSVLLRLALESSPSSGLFPNSLLIGRIRTTSGLEVVVNAIPFSASHENVRTFAEQVDREFLPRMGSNLREIRTHVWHAQEVWRRTLWQAIQAGWREGWAATLVVGSLDEAAPLGPDFTRFSVRSDPERTYDLIRESCSRRPFEFELDLTGDPTETSAERIVETVRPLRASGRNVHFLAPSIHGGGFDFEGKLARLNQAAKQFNAVLSLEYIPELAAVVRKVTGGRVHYRIHRQPEDIGRP